MTAGRQRARKAANGNGKSPRSELASVFDAAMADADVLREEKVAEFKALNDAKRALRGDGHPGFDITAAIREVQSAILRGEVEVVAEDGRVAFYLVTRERIA
jgi:hypothetical protein